MPPDGSSMTTDKDILATRNRAWGFFGAMGKHAREAWPIVVAAGRWMGWTIGRRTSRDHGILQGLPCVTFPGGSRRDLQSRLAVSRRRRPGRLAWPGPEGQVDSFIGIGRSGMTDIHVGPALCAAIAWGCSLNMLMFGPIAVKEGWKVPGVALMSAPRILAGLAAGWWGGLVAPAAGMLFGSISTAILRDSALPFSFLLTIVSIVVGGIWVSLLYCEDDAWQRAPAVRPRRRLAWL